jgi:hypothetical protein
MALPSSLEKVQLATTASTVPEKKIKMITLGTKMKTRTMGRYLVRTGRQCEKQPNLLQMECHAVRGKRALQ